MATATASLQFDNTSTANFRAWGTGIAALFLTGGFWQQTTDTGQINWTTVAVPASGTFAGYEIYKSVDALSSSNPVFLRVDYGSNASATLGPAIKFAFATGSNGAGTLTGNVSTTYIHQVNLVGTGATLHNFWASGGPGYFNIILWDSTTANISAFWCLERSLDSTGAYTNNYLTWVLCVNNTFSQRSIMKPSLGSFATELGNAFTLFFSGTSAAMGTFASPFPVFPFQGFPDNPMTAIMGMKSGDITEGASFNVTLYGTSHNYLWTNRTNTNLGPNTPSIGLGIRFE